MVGIIYDTSNDAIIIGTHFLQRRYYLYLHVIQQWECEQNRKPANTSNICKHQQKDASIRRDTSNIRDDASNSRGTPTKARIQATAPRTSASAWSTAA